MNLTQEQKQFVEETVKKILEKEAAVTRRLAGKLPALSLDGFYDDRYDKSKTWNLDDGINWWTNGFPGGINWQMYHATKDPIYAEQAELTEVQLDEAFDQYLGLHHDVGFMWLPTAVANYRETGSESARRRALHAANLLAGRFNFAGKFIRAWNDDPVVDRRGWAIIDCLFNIPLLYWATEETGDPRFTQIARMHADTAEKYFVREDGSVNHIVEFDPNTGEFVKSYGGQGYAEGSSWTRGQAWAIYGFAISYKRTGNESYLATAKKTADYFTSCIPENDIIPVDFRAPKEPAWEDSTAAAIAACGMIEIAKSSGEDKYLETALRLLTKLANDRADYSKETDALLLKCSSSYHDTKHDFSLIYGDYFFMEAFWKLADLELFIW